MFFRTVPMKKYYRQNTFQDRQHRIFKNRELGQDDQGERVERGDTIHIICFLIYFMFVCGPPPFSEVWYNFCFSEIKKSEITGWGITSHPCWVKDKTISGDFSLRLSIGEYVC